MEKQSSFSTFETAELKKFHSALSRSPFTELVGNGTASKVELLTSCHLFCQMCVNLKEVKIPYLLECYDLTIYYLPSEPLEKEGDTFRLGTALVEGVSIECLQFSGRKKFLQSFEIFQGSVQHFSHFCCSITFDFLPFFLHLLRWQPTFSKSKKEIQKDFSFGFETKIKPVSEDNFFVLLLKIKILFVI